MRRLLLISALAVLSSCGQSGSSARTTIPDFIPPAEGTPFPVTRVDEQVVHEETIPTLDESANGIIESIDEEPHPKNPAGCSGVSDATINSITEWNIPSTWWQCSQGWLLAMSNDCGECEGVTVFHRSGGTWAYADVSCHNYHLSAKVCGPDAGGPPQSVMCAIWENDRVLAALPVSGCNARRSDIVDAVTKKCDYWTEWDPSPEWVPFGNCQYGWPVKQFQTRLANRGYATNTDGFFGPTSALATLGYQHDAGLKLTASLDAPTVASVLAD